MYASVARVGQATLDAVAGFGRFVQFSASALHWFALRADVWCHWRRLAPQLYTVGVASIPVVAITGAFIGMVLALEGYPQFEALGQQARLGGIISVSVTKQIGPVLAAVMVAGRVGGALAAELGTMRVTEQLDALRAMAADPVGHLVVPRVVACVAMTPFLTVYSNLLGVWGGWLVTVPFYGVSPFEFWQYNRIVVHWWDPVSGLIKSVFFGAAIGLIACYNGFFSRPGAAGVGRAATDAFVQSFLAIIVMNLVLAKVLNTIYSTWISPGGVMPLG